MELKEFEEQVENAFKLTATFNLVLNLAMAFALKYLWNMVNILQFLVFIVNWQFNYPNNGEIFLRKVRYLVFMEFIPYEAAIDWISSILSVEEECSDCVAEREERLL